MLDNHSLHSRILFSFPEILRHQLDDTAGFCDLALGQLADVSGAYHEGEFGQTSLAQQFGVAEVKQVDNGGCVFRLAGDVFLVHVLREERGKLDRVALAGVQ